VDDATKHHALRQLRTPVGPNRENSNDPNQIATK